ncbi:divalent-cation tolerance protein CutA [Pelagerythrobacter marensis]|uniref:Periplasmic divalent cation tolerance protein n=1 Tax=Pelagerythrobacter marensis TaxID=543877 RepID=A0A0G3XDD3_9SPHN|nr:divalent-cation tolerance protein CutA [Pelagerythrobacter marensis]AKM08423.1 Periplasmic divalent cation tolerance protein [Pelagerythrobacter marensis]
MSALVWCSCPDEDTAVALARQLVGEGLAACGNAIGPMRSVFAWNGGVEEAGECGLLLKTDARVLDCAVSRLEALHPYDAPAVLGWRCDAAGAATAAWLGALVPDAPGSDGK